MIIMGIDSNIGLKIKKFRKRAKISQFELEIRMSAASGSISRMENGDVNPTKETLLKIIEVLNIPPGDAASLFNINIDTEVRKMADVSVRLNEPENFDQMLDVITNKISIYAGGNAATLWLWDEFNSTLRLERIMAIPKVVAFVEKVLKISSNKLVLDSKNIEQSKNHYLQCILQKKVIVSSYVSQLAHTVLNKTMSAIVEKWLNFKIAVSLPLMFKDKILGVFSLIWDGDELTQKHINNLQSYADQIAIAIYNVQKYQELEEKYNSLLKLKNGK